MGIFTLLELTNEYRRDAEKREAEGDKKEFFKIKGRWEKLFTKSPTWFPFRDEIRARDGPICPFCKVRRINDVHHIDSAWDFPVRQFDPYNCNALCGTCHIEAGSRKRRLGS